MASSERLQTRRDRELRAALSGDRDVQAALKRFEQRTCGFGFTERRRLLADALRLTRSIAPEVAETLAACREMLGYQAPVEVYVRPDPMLNASAMRSVSGMGIIVLSSRLLEVFSSAELRFVMGHELGHLAFEHHYLPMPATALIEDAAGVIVPRKTALQLYHWARAAEISADRAGLVCGRDPRAAASGFFKLASGLASDRVQPDLEAYARQTDSLASAPTARAKLEDDDTSLDCFSTHPYNPVRVRAVVSFARSRAYKEAVGLPLADEDMSEEQIDAVVEQDLRLMEPTYLEEKGAEAELLRRLLYLAGMSVASAHADVDERERLALAKLLGADEIAQQARATSDIRAELESILERARASVSSTSLGHLVQHLTVVASADGDVDTAEIVEMERVATRLDVDPVIVSQTLRSAALPLD